MDTYTYSFKSSVSPDDLEETLMLSLLAVESIHGHAKVRMESRFHMDKQNRTCKIEAATEVGSHLASVFTGFAVKEYGEDAVYVKRLEREAPGISEDVRAA